MPKSLEEPPRFDRVAACSSPPWRAICASGAYGPLTRATHRAAAAYKKQRAPRERTQGVAVNRYLPMAFVLLATGPAQAAEKVLDKTFPVSPGGSLIVDADAGEVRVTGGNGSQVVVHMMSRDTEGNLANTTLEAVQNGNAVT